MGWEKWERCCSLLSPKERVTTPHVLFYITPIHNSLKLSLLLTGLSMLRGQQVLKNLCESCNNSSQGRDYIIITPTQNYCTIDVHWWHFWETEVSLTVIPTLSNLLPLPFSSTQVLVTIFLFSTSFSIFSSIAACYHHKTNPAWCHVLQTLLYFRINWYWFSPEIRHWLTFNSISLAPKLPNHFQAQSTVAPKAHGHTAPTWAIQDTKYLLPFPKLQLEVPGGKSGREITWMLTFICSYCKALENITFCIF